MVIHNRISIVVLLLWCFCHHCCAPSIIPIILFSSQPIIKHFEETLVFCAGLPAKVKIYPNPVDVRADESTILKFRFFDSNDIPCYLPEGFSDWRKLTPEVQNESISLNDFELDDTAISCKLSFEDNGQSLSKDSPTQLQLYFDDPINDRETVRLVLQPGKPVSYWKLNFDEKINLLEFTSFKWFSIDSWMSQHILIIILYFSSCHTF